LSINSVSRPPHNLILSRVNSIQSTLSPNFNLSANLYLIHVAVEILTAIIIKNNFLWDMTPCSQRRAHRRFGETCYIFWVEEKVKHISQQGDGGKRP
jgi:hypothetical protein